VKLASVNVNAMFVRPGTPAADDPKLKSQQLSSQVVKRRAKEATEVIARHREGLEQMLGKETQVWICERAHDGVSWAAHTKEYVQVLLEASAFKEPTQEQAADPSFSNIRRVRITEVGKWSVKGVLIE